MKFLCPNCKAKYQIADDKVGGRTLKMDCRKCKHTIVLRREQQTSDDSNASRGLSARPPSRSEGGSGLHGNRRPSPRASAPMRPAPRSALTADFKRGATSIPPLPPEAPRPTPLDQWHVAINDVPVGPMRRDEVSRKISTGAVTADSLAWREGFDDWRPIREIPDLAPLLKRSEAAAEARRLGPSARPPAGRIPPIAPRGAAPRPVARPATRPGDRPDAAAARSRANVVPIAGRLGNAAPALDEEDLDANIDAEPTRIAHMAGLSDDVAPTHDDDLAVPFAGAAESTLTGGETAAEPSDGRKAAVAPGVGSASVASPTSPFTSPEPRPTNSTSQGGRPPLGIPVGAWIAIAGASVFGAVLAVLVAPRLMGAASAPLAVNEPVHESAPETQPPSEPELEIPETVEAETVEADGGVEDAEVAEAVAENMATRRPTGPTGRATRAPAGNTTGATAEATPSGGGTDWDQFDTAGGTPAPIRRPVQGSSSSTDSRPSLEPDQIATVVRREQRGLQGCWEVAIRGMSNVPTVRMDIDITIGTSGTVTRATARGAGLGNLSTCLERNVRRWRFPASGGTTPASFPVVFQGTN